MYRSVTQGTFTVRKEEKKSYFRWKKSNKSRSLSLTVHHTRAAEVCGPVPAGLGSLCHQIHPLTESRRGEKNHTGKSTSPLTLFALGYNIKSNKNTVKMNQSR